MPRKTHFRLFKGLGIVTAALGLICLTGCSEDTQSKPQTYTTNKPAMEDDMPNKTIEDVKDKAVELADTAKQFASQTREEYEQAMKDRLARLDDQIEDYEKRANELTAESREKIDQQLERLKEKRQEFEKSFQEFQAESGDAWKELKSGLSKAWDDLKSATQEAGKQFQN